MTDIGKPRTSFEGPIEGVSEIPTEPPSLDKVPPTPKEKDTMATSTGARASFAVESDEPIIPQPDEEKTNEVKHKQAIQEIKTNPWLVRSFLACFALVMFELLNVERQIHFKEAIGEIENRERIFKFAQDVAKLAKELMDNQAKEQMIQAIASFANAGISSISFMQTTRNVKLAENQIDNEIAEQRLIAGGTSPSSTIQTSRTAATTTAPPTTAERQTAQANVDELTKHRQQNIQTRIHHLDSLSQYFSETQKQMVSGVTGVLMSQVKTDTGVKEQMQKELEGLIQAMNKYSESLTKARDEASQNFGRFIDFLNRIIESDFKAHLLSGRS